MKITRSAIANLPQPGNQRRTFWDETLPGFGITQQVSGKIAYVAKFRIGQRQIMKTLGSYPTLSPEDARKVFAQFKANAAIGIDLAEKIREENRRDDTMSDLCDIYKIHHLPRKRERSAYEDTRKIEIRIKPALGTKRICDVTRSDIKSLHAKMRATPIEANRVLALISKMFSIAVLDGRRPDNPARGIEKYPETARERYLSKDEATRLDAALAEFEIAHFETVMMIRLLRLTGARKGEVVGAKWSQFDLDSGLWVKPAATTKQKKEHRVPLAEAAVEVLKAIKAVKPPRKPSDSLFSLSIAGRMTALKRLWPQICAKADLEEFRIHDLRHTFASTVIGCGSSLPIVGALLGHTQASTTNRYAHLADDPLREALKAIR